MTTEQLYQVYLRNPIICTDTRKMVPGALFFALSGPNFDGNQFATGALEQGAAHAIIDSEAYSSGTQTILVPDVLRALQQLAAHHRRQFHIPFVAITGSNGKTTTKELLAAVLSKKYKTYATGGNLNNHIGVPLTLLSIRLDAGMALIEMGANHQREIAGYCEIAQPTHGLITNCGKAHIEGFGGEEGVRKGKGELYDYLRDHRGAIFRNCDLGYLEGMARGIVVQVTYGSGHADYTGEASMSGVLLQVALTHPVPALLRTNLVGDYNFPNVMAAVAVGRYFGVSVADIADALANYHPDNSRSQWLAVGDNQVILDAYNANPSSMQAAILNFAKADLPGKTLWIGGMKEMGADEQREHRALVSLIDEFNWEEVLLVGPELEPVAGKYPWFPDSRAAAIYVSSHLPHYRSILVKGSRGSRMELLLDALRQGAS